MLRACWTRGRSPSKVMLQQTCCSMQGRGMAFQTASVADQMIDHVTKSCQDNPDQAVDILRSGIALQAGSSASLELARLLLTLANVEAGRQNWGEVASTSQRAVKAVADAPFSAPHVALAVVQGYSLAVRAALLQGRDEEAAGLASAAVKDTGRQVADGVPCAEHTAALGLELLTQHARGDQGGAGGSAQHLAQVLDTPMQSTGARQNLFASAMTALAGWRLSEEEATALLGQAQVRIDHMEWEGAEELLGTALSAAERAHGDTHPNVVPVLLQLGHCYARTARHMLAEGLYRQCSKLLQVDPALVTTGHRCNSCHPSLAAVLAWRYCQLLSALPNRDNEASAWHALAELEWLQSGTGLLSHPLEEVLGSRKRLKGEGAEGRGLLLDVASLRVLPRCSPVAQV